MTKRIEDLSSEVWLEIFEYLNVEDQFKAFFNLNRRITGVLVSYRSRICLNDTQNSVKLFIKHVFPKPDAINSISSLRLERMKDNKLLREIGILQFPRLRQLVIHRSTITDDLLELIKKSSDHLQHIFVSPFVSGNKNQLKQLLNLIISLPCLQYCRLRLGIAMSPLSLTVSSSSPVTELHLRSNHENLFWDRCSILLQYFPRLQSLNIVAQGMISSPNRTFPNEKFVCPVKILYLKINRLELPLNEWIKEFMDSMKYLEKFTLVAINSLNDLSYLDLLTWRKIVETLPFLREINLLISPSAGINKDRWIKKSQTLTKILAKKGVSVEMTPNFLP